MMKNKKQNNAGYDERQLLAQLQSAKAALFTAFLAMILSKVIMYKVPNVSAMFIIACVATISATVYWVNVIWREAYYVYNCTAKNRIKDIISHWLLTMIALVICTIMIKDYAQDGKLVRALLYDNKDNLVYVLGITIVFVISGVVLVIKTVYDRIKLRAEDMEESDEE